ncbi:MAG: ATP-binding cassette domain-containing protein [Acidimicrobiia bacterium]
MSGIRLTGVSKRYGRVQALDGIDLSAERGITGLLGPNGAGKTTLLRVLATVQAPDAGSVELLGHDPADAEQRRSIRRRLGYMPQEPGFYDNFTVFEFVDYIAILKQLTDRRKRHDEVREVLGLVELTAEARRKVRDLSGGMRRRLALAQALLDRPDLLLLDEPTSGLDPAQRLRFRELVSQLPNRPVVLLSTHQTEDIAAVCERVVVIAAGRVQFDGAPDALRQVAVGRVWISDRPNAQTLLSWRSGDGTLRHVGEPPSGADLVEPTIDDAYLLLSGSSGGAS